MVRRYLSRTAPGTSPLRSLAPGNARGWVANLLQKKGLVVTAWPSRPCVACRRFGVARGEVLCPGCLAPPPRPPVPVPVPAPAPRPVEPPAPEPAPVPLHHEARGGVYLQHVLERVLELEPEPPGEWVQDATGQILQPDGAPWLEPDDPPGIDVRDLPVWTPRPAPTRPVGAPARVAPPLGPSRPPTRRRGAVPWAPLPAAPPDTPWRVTRDVHVRTLSPNRLMSEHFRSRASRRNREHGAIGDAFRGVTMPDDGSGWIVTFVRVGPALLDHGDRLSGSLSAIRDALADRLTAGDDSPRAPVQWVYRQHREVVREPHRYPARHARPADPARGLPARAERPGRDGWRYRTWLRVIVETATEHTTGGPNVQCEPGSLADALKVRRECRRTRPPPKGSCGA